MSPIYARVCHLSRVVPTVGVEPTPLRVWTVFLCQLGYVGVVPEEGFEPSLGRLSTYFLCRLGYPGMVEQAGIEPASNKRRS